MTPRTNSRPVASAGSARNIPLAELYQALVTARLHGQLWPAHPERKAVTPWTPNPVTVRPASHPIIVRAKLWSEQQLLADLRNEALTAYVPGEQKGQFIAIPKSFWHARHAGLSVTGRLFLQDDNDGLTKHLQGSKIFVLKSPHFSGCSEERSKTTTLTIRGVSKKVLRINT